MKRLWKGTVVALALALAFICVSCGSNDADKQTNGSNASPTDKDNNTADIGESGDEMNDNAQYGADNDGKVDEDGANPGDSVGDTGDGNGLNDAANDVGDAAKDVTDAAKDTVTGAADAASDAVKDVANGAESVVDDVTGR